MSQPPLHIMMLGLRSFPGVQGGVEAHAENLCPRLVRLGCKVTVLARSPYHSASVKSEWRRVRFVSLWAPKSKALEAIMHTFIGVLYAAIKRPDVLHIQAIGPGLLAPVARLLGLRVVVTHHGPDYDRQKWGRFARFVLHTGERFGICFSNERIVISEVIHQLVLKKYGVHSNLIPNGVGIPEIPDSKKAIEDIGLQAGRYILLVSRIVSEKRHHDLIQAFLQADLPGWKLVIVGASDHPDTYTQSVLDAAQSTASIICTGFQSGTILNELYAHAGIFVLPSSHEGLPIALLEALSYGLQVLASDIPANKEVGLSREHYFPLGDIEQLQVRLRQFSRQALSHAKRDQLRKWVQTNYNWDNIAQSTLEVYLSLSSEELKPT